MLLEPELDPILLELITAEPTTVPWVSFFLCWIFPSTFFISIFLHFFFSSLLLLTAIPI
jgi:hypothetical protein